VSALTKLFVLLLVVLSLVETAGIVVYVNRAENFSRALGASRADVAAAKADAAAAKDQSGLAEIARQQVQADSQGYRNSSQQTIDGLRASILEKETAIAQLNANLLQATAAQKSAGDALLVLQKSVDLQNGQMADLRKQNLDLQKRDSENSLALIALNNKFDTVNRQWRDATEQNAELQNNLKSVQESAHRAGVSNLNSAPTLNPESLIRVDGVIKDKSNINGVTMATISVGSADQVTKGMRFIVIDRNSPEPFLGYLFVTQVDPDRAIGRLEGPRVDRIRAGLEVRTQL
jgi:hypothetical protein